MLQYIHIFGFHVPMYSLLVFLGIVAYVVTYFLYVEKAEKLDRATSNRMLLVSVIGIAALYLFAFLFDGIYHSIENGKPSFGGITWLGGVIGSFPVIVVLIHYLVPKAKGNELYYFSLIIPGIVIGHMFGRLGCFCGGCCYGGLTDGPFGVSFPANSTAAKQYPAPSGGSLMVYPTQLFEAAFELALFIVLIVFRKKLKQYNLVIYLFSYAVFRFLIEFLRGDDRGSLGAALSPAQWNCFLLIIAGVLIVLFMRGIIFKKLELKCVGWREQAANYVPPVKSSGRSDAETLEDLHRLYQQKIITKDEYNKKKAEILKRM